MVYTLDFAKELENAGVIVKQFADDVKIYREISTVDDCVALQQGIDLVKDWSRRWCLPLAPEKTVHMRIGTSSAALDYCIDGQCIGKVTSVKDLGFVYDEKLDFSEHIKLICRKGFIRLFQIFKALATNDRRVLTMAYKIYIRPIVEFGSLVFSPRKKRDVALLEKVQKSFTRRVLRRTGGFLYSRIPRASIRNAYFGLHTLESRRKLKDVCTVLKMLTGRVRCSVSECYSVTPSRTRGGSMKLTFARASTNLRARSFTCRAASAFVALRFGVPASPHASAEFKRIATNALLEH